MKRSALLIGNSPNRLSQGYSWEDLLKELVKSVPKSTEVQHAHEKPFPLLYEEILAHIRRRSRRNEKDIKERIVALLGKVQPNPIHELFSSLGVTNILTTNYDYNIEHASGHTMEDAWLARETTFSLFRRAQINDQYVWHVHGELKRPNSITLGYDHYVSYLSELKKYLAYQTTTRTTPIKCAIKTRGKRFDRGDEPYSWADVFLSHDVHIVGLGLDYTEIDIWWLICYKERLRDTNFKWLGKTYYYYFQSPSKKSDPVSKETVRLSLLESMGVEVVPVVVNNNDYQKAHQRLIKGLKTRTSRQPKV